MPSSHDPQAPTWRLALNVYLQRYRRNERVRWVASSIGPRQRPHWTVTCYLSDIAFGTGRGLSKSEAKERAARDTLELIYRQHMALASIEYFRWATESHPVQPIIPPPATMPQPLERSPRQPAVPAVQPSNLRTLPPLTLPERKRSS